MWTSSEDRTFNPTSNIHCAAFSVSTRPPHLLGQPLFWFLLPQILLHVFEFISVKSHSVHSCVSSSFTQHTLCEIFHGVAPISPSLFPLLGSIPVYGCSNSSGHSPVDGHWECFHLLAITNTAAINILVQAVLWPRASFLLRKHPGVNSWVIWKTYDLIF